MSRAIALLLQGKAQALACRPGEVVRSASESIDYPTVIRLERYIRLPYRRSAPLTRNGVLQRDNHTCIYCGRDGRTIDHIIPRSRGGDSSWLNLAACCQKCNNKKGDSLLAELGWRLRFSPHEPDYRTFYISKLTARRIEPAWSEWLSLKAA
ncbi:HNH endonuclease [Microbacterium hatanonis]|nr:HNH endonuclease [Microbacterium hatanonis]